MKIKDIINEMKYPSLEEFLKSSIKNQYIKEFGLISYYRKDFIYMNGEKKKVLTRANTKSISRPLNFEINDKIKSTGNYRKLDELTTKLAKKYGYNGIKVEHVMNKFLPNKLIQYGYYQSNVDDEFGNPPTFYKEIS